MPQVALWGKGILCKKSAENTNYTTLAWLYRLLSAEIALAHISCGFEENENKFNTFIQGDAYIVLNLCNDELTLENARKVVSLFETMIYNRRNSEEKKQLYVDMLKYGDYSLYDGGGSWTFGEWMERWNLLDNDEDWFKLLSDNSKKDIVKDYLYKEPVHTPKNRDWTNFIIDYDGLGYMQKHKFLWKEYPGTDILPHVILLSSHQASKFSSRELAIQILHKKLAGSWVWNFQTCVMELNIDGDEIRVAEQGSKGYYLDIIYHWNKVQPFWNLSLGHREKQLGEDLLHTFRVGTQYEWKCSKDGKLEVASFYPGDNVVIKENEEDAAENVKEAIDKLLPQLYKILKDNHQP